ncbi:DUF2062 domain-containing protein [Teichococcus aestuarii]|uniref:DUF2062 domain-containing protein n=1 Tax=Teichococcus aestuarii TaxID=568898 RepID=UPI00360B5084
MMRALRERWAGLLASPGGARRVARGLAAGAAAAMLPAFGLHLLFAAGFALLLRGSLPVAAAACLALGNPLTHAVLLPAEYALGRLLLPPSVEFLPEHGPAWLLALLPAAEETVAGGVVLAGVAGLLGWLLARRALVPGAAAPEAPLRVIHLNGAINSGKSSVGRALAALIPGAGFIEGDEHGLPAELPPEQRWAGALGRILRRIRESNAPCLVSAYPLDEAGYRRLRTACVARGATLSVVTLAPPLEVALGPRGGRVPDAAEQARIRAMYAEGYHRRLFSDVTLDNAGLAPEEAARRVLAALAHAHAARAPGAAGRAAPT